MSVSQEYEKIIANYKDEIAQTSLRQDSVEYQTNLSSNAARLLNLKTSVYSKLALFSNNESLEDVSTSSIKFLGIDYYLGAMFARKQATGSQVTSSMVKQKLKLKFLQKSEQLYIQFLLSLYDYELLDELLSKKIDAFEDTFKPTIQELYVTSTHDKNLSGAYAKRDQKIAMFKRNKEVEQTLKSLESKYSNKNEQDKDDDENLRSMYIQRLKQLSFMAFNEMEQNLYEIEMLSNLINGTIEEKITETEKLEPTDEKHKKDPTNYTEKLETLNRPLLSKKGKVLRNFTIVDKKSDLKNKVRGYGQYGPTMTVEEFLEKEFEEGRVLQGGEEQVEEHDSDDEKYQNEQTYKAREWDDFKDSHAKGSGNTTNRG